MLLFILPTYVEAQLIPKLENIILLQMTPVNPGPRENVTLSARSFSIDLNTSSISWFINDVLQQEAVGETVFRFVTEGLGSNTIIDIVAETSDGELETQRITIRPTQIDIVWQADTFVHPFYKGKRRASVGASINVEAVPHFIDNTGQRLRTDELIYRWKANNKILLNVSGRGKNTITVSQKRPRRSLSVEVEIESFDKTLFGKRTIRIPITDSELFVYENNPLLGVLFNNAIDGVYSLKGQETKFIAYPFFMSLVDRNSPDINYVWKLNNNSITLGEDRGSIAVSNVGGDAGEALISVSIQNFQKIFQRSSSQFKIEFGRDSSLNTLF